MKHGGRRTPTCVLCVLSFALCVLARPALAQTTTDDLSVTASIGWNGVVPSDRWAPITVYITAGEKAVQGTITLEFPQNPTQRAVIVAPFAATPDKTIPVTLVASLPAGCERLTLTVQPEGRRRARILSFDRSGSANTIPMANTLEESEPLVLVVGRSTLPDAAKDWAGLAGSLSRRDRIDPTILPPIWGHIVFARAEPEGLPSIPAAYGGLACMVAPGDAAGRVDRATLAAIHEWVRSGGRLLISLDSPGDAWREWLPDEAKPLVLADPQARVAIPGAIGSLITKLSDDLTHPKDASERLKAELRKRAAQDPFSTGDEELPTNENPTPAKDSLPAAAADASARPLRLGADGARMGWALSWQAGATADTGLLADGPVGFGHVYVLGVEPTRTPSTLSTRASGAVWRGALEPALRELVADPGANRDPRARVWWQHGHTQTAINSCLERLAHVSMVGGWVIGVLAAALGLLVLLVGPIDYFVLKRLRAGQHWWLTALGWTAIACLGTYLAPQIIRTSPTQVGRLSVIDQLIYPAPAGQTPRSLTRAAGITTFYSGESGIVRPTVDAASWWRGTAALVAFYARMNNSAARGIAPTVQAAAGGDSGSTRGNPLQPFPMPLWTFHAFLDESSPQTSVTVRLRRDGDGWRTVVTGIPEGARVSRVELRIGAKRFAMDDRPPPAAQGGSWEAVLPLSAPNEERPPTQPSNPYEVAPFNTGSALNIPGPDRRSSTFLRLLATNRWAILVLTLDHCPPEPALTRPAEYDHTRILRIAVPLDEPDAAPPGENPA